MGHNLSSNIISNWSVRKFMKQHLAGFLHQEVIKKVNQESTKEWLEKLEKGKLVELKKIEVKENNVGWYNLVANALRELRP